MHELFEEHGVELLGAVVDAAREGGDDSAPVLWVVQGREDDGQHHLRLLLHQRAHVLAAPKVQTPLRNLPTF